MAYFEAVHLPGGTFSHHAGSSKGGTKPAGGWLAALEAEFGEDLVCAKYGCTRDAELGAHVRLGFVSEAGKLIGLGGTAVVPCCNKHHPKAGDLTFRVKATPALIDTTCPVNSGDMAALATGTAFAAALW